jgi:hypothetical protein
MDYADLFLRTADTGYFSPGKIQVSEREDTLNPALRIASDTAGSLRLLSTDTDFVACTHTTVADGSIALMAFSMAAVQCPQLMSGTVKLLIGLSLIVTLRMGASREGRSRKISEAVDLPVRGGPRCHPG